MGKPCPGGTAPSVQVNALCCSTAAAAELLTPPTRPLSPGQGDRVASLVLAVCAARRWKVRSEGAPTWSLVCAIRRM